MVPTQRYVWEPKSIAGYEKKKTFICIVLWNVFHLGCFQLQAVKPATQNSWNNEGNLLVHVNLKSTKAALSSGRLSAAKDWASFHLFPLSSAAYSWRLASMITCSLSLGCRLPHSDPARMRESLSLHSLCKSPETISDGSGLGHITVFHSVSVARKCGMHWLT